MASLDDIWKETHPQGSMDDIWKQTHPQQKPAEPEKSGTLPGFGFLADLIKSFPQGMVKGAVGAASRAGQAEEGLARGALGEGPGGGQPVPSPAQSMQFPQVKGVLDRLPAQAPGAGGSIGGFLGEMAGTPSVPFPGAGLVTDVAAARRGAHSSGRPS